MKLKSEIEKWPLLVERACQQETNKSDKSASRTMSWSMTTPLFSPKLHQVIHLISVLLRSCHTPASVTRYHQGITTDAKTKRDIRAQLLKLPQESLITKDDNGVLTLLPLHENDSKLLHERLFYNRIAGDSHDNCEILQYTCDVACHSSFEDLQFSKEVSKLIVEGTDRSDLNRVGTFLSMLRRLVMMGDTIKEQRFEQLCDCNPPKGNDANEEQEPPNFQG